MIDYLKIHSLPVLPEKLLKNDLLTFPQSNVSTEGEALNRWQIAHFQNLEIGIKGNNSKLSGSPHKYKQDGKNWQDFKLFDIQNTIQELSVKFDFDPEMAVINFIEIGINIPLDYNPDQIINCLVIHGKEIFERMRTDGKGNGRESVKDQFTIKIYNKSLQNTLPFHLLRYEIKVKRMRFLERYGIYGLTLADLTRQDVYPKFKTMLLDILSGILIYNPDIEPDNITNFNDRELLKLGKFADYWQQMERRRKSEKLIRFKELAGTNEIIENLKSKISEKWKILSNPDIIPTFRKEEIKQGNHQPGHYPTTIKGEYVRTCKVTGLPIPYPRPGKENIKIEDVQWYYENEPETYQQRLESLLTDKWITRHYGEPIKKRIAEIYHMIRNKKSNPKNDALRDYFNVENKGLKLPGFSTIEYMHPDKLRLIKSILIEV